MTTGEIRMESGMPDTTSAATTRPAESRLDLRWRRWSSRKWMRSTDFTSSDQRGSRLTAQPAKASHAGVAASIIRSG